MTRRDEVLEALYAVVDPELGIDIVNLGLIYQLEIDEPSGRVTIVMTLTVPGCPMHNTITRDVTLAVRSLPWVTDVAVQLTFDPPWGPHRLSDLARTALAH
jgi:metal-sulfur cluster biosynthetic enzyme